MWLYFHLIILIVGVTVAAVAAVAIIAALVAFFIWKKKHINIDENSADVVGCQESSALIIISIQ